MIYYIKKKYIYQLCTIVTALPIHSNTAVYISHFHYEIEINFII